jgi:hypothetical protein
MSRKRPSPESKRKFWSLVVGEPSGHDGLWQRVEHWRQRLANCDDYPSLSGLEQTWNIIVAHEASPADMRGERAADNPLSALFYYVDLGFYPPPEILLALMDAFDVYNTSEGVISLEEVFFGPTRRKAGTYAKRKATRMRRFHWGLSMERHMKRGATKARAAELVAQEWRGMYEPETIARLALLPRAPAQKRKISG